jgi:endonuclease/exonuclease/phosphatase family metal-dependent hydrolase
VIGLQENEATAPAGLPLTALAPLLPDYTPVLPDLEVPLLVRTAAYEVAAADSLDIGQGFWDRRVAWAWLVHRRTGRELLVANTHLDPFERPDLAAARRAEVAAIIAVLGELDPEHRTPAVLTGDLNIHSTGLHTKEPAPLDLLARAGFRDSLRSTARDASPVDHAATLNAFGTEVDGTWRYRAISRSHLRIDYVFVAGEASVASYQVVTGPGVHRVGGQPYFADGPVPSDHCPVMVDLAVAAT